MLLLPKKRGPAPLNFVKRCAKGTIQGCGIGGSQVFIVPPNQNVANDGRTGMGSANSIGEIQ